MNQIHNVDCIQYMSTLSNNSVNLTLTDIPYAEVNRKSNGLRNLDKGKADISTFELDIFVSDVIRITSGSIYIFCGTEQVSEIRRIMVSQKLSTRLCIWQKSNPSPMNGQYIWLSGIECCVFGKKPKATFNEHCKNSVWVYPVTRKALHPTEKPQKLLQYLINTSSNEGDIVFDPCAGSGSTLFAAKTLNRNYLGCEINADFYDITLNRLK